MLVLTGNRAREVFRRVLEGARHSSRKSFSSRARLAAPPRHRAAVPPCRCVDRSRQLPPANRISNEPLSLCASTNQFCNEGSLWRGRKPAPHLRITRFELALTPCFRSPLNGTRRHYGNSKLIASWRNRPLAIKLRTTRV